MIRNFTVTSGFGILAQSLVFLLLLSRAAGAQNTEDPKLQNPERAAELLQQRYPEDLRLLGIGGTVKLNVRVRPNPPGAVDSITVLTGSGVPALDEVAIIAARSFRFVPPTEAKWVELELKFDPDTPAAFGYSSLPQLMNRELVRNTAWAAVPERTRKARVRGTVPVEVLVDSAGRPQSTRITRYGCIRDYDQAALQSAAILQFGRAESASNAAPRRTIITFEFNTDSLVVRTPGEARIPGGPRTPPPTPPNFTPYTLAPRLRNAGQLASALQKLYPPHLRNAGIGGTVGLWLFIDERGNVQRREIKTSSGICDLDLAALAVSERMRFDPGRHGETPTKVWVDMPVVFKSR